MKYLRLLVGIAIALIVSITMVIVQPRTAAKEYVASIEKKRAEIDEFMQFSGESPLPSEAVETFSGLNYFPVDPAFRVLATIKRFDEQERIDVPTSAGTADPYSRYGLISFEIDGQELTLEAWKPLEGMVSNRLFVAFTDATSGGETYGGGRYLNLYTGRGDALIVDFNLAHNPYCVYDPTYICPLAPPENRLPVAIRAGETNWE